MPILCLEAVLWQLARYVPNFQIVEQLNDVSPQESVVPVVHFAGYKELNTEVLECSFFVALVFCRLLREQTKPARNWTFASAKLLEDISPVPDCSNQLGCQRFRVLLLGGTGGFK